MKRLKQTGGKEIIVILHNIRSAYNVGSVFRTADAFGISKIYLGGYTPDPGNNKSIIKTALGAENFVSWEKVWHTGKLIKNLKKEGYQIIAVELSSDSINLTQYQSKFPLVLVMGNEVKGLSKNILALADEVVEIPMLGQKESLNVAVSFAVTAYEICRQKLECYKK